MTVWLARRIVVAIHEIQLAKHGGAPGIHDPELLDGALARPMDHPGYDEPDVAGLAALYALSIIRNHPFIDGNKRTGFAVMTTFLALNGVDFDPPDVEATITILRIAEGSLTDDAFATWVRSWCKTP